MEAWVNLVLIAHFLESLIIRTAWISPFQRNNTECLTRNLIRIWSVFSSMPNFVKSFHTWSVPSWQPREKFKKTKFYLPQMLKGLQSNQETLKPYWKSATRHFWRSSSPLSFTSFSKTLPTQERCLRLLQHS